jgi:hypothetical protein
LKLRVASFLCSHLVAGDSYLSLPNLSNVNERKDALGPLYATAVKASIPAFGQNRFGSPGIISSLDAKIKKALESVEDVVEDILAPISGHESDQHDITAESIALDDSQLRTKIRNKNLQGEISRSGVSTKVLTSRELHDKSHYATLSRLPASKITHDHLDHIRLYRAISGYLFDCQLNKKIVSEDAWLKGVWEWVAGMLFAHPIFSGPIVNSAQVPRSSQSMMVWFRYLLT